MKKLLIILATMGLMFNVIGCKAKKAVDETEIVENADVEKIDAEDANFSGNETTVQAGSVDDSLQAALGETPQTDTTTTTTTTTTDSSVASTDAVNTDVAAAPTVDETIISPTTTDVVTNTEVTTTVAETPVVESTKTEISQAQTDTSLTPDTVINGGVAEMNTNTTVTETPISETPVASNISDTTTTITETPVVSESHTETVISKASTENSVVSTSSSFASSSKGILKKIVDASPYKHGDGFVNTVYIARPKEKLADISKTIYGMDKSKELKAINTYLKSHGPRPGDKIYYISPNRPTDSTRTISFYEDTGMMAATYTAQKGDNLAKISKKLLGYDNAWKEIWTTNPVESKGRLTAGETLRYWKGVDQISTSTTLANNSGNAKLIDSTQTVAANVQSPPPQPPAPPAQAELPPPPPAPPQEVAQQQAQPPAPPAQAELPPPPPAQQQMTPPPPPPPPQEVAAAPVPPKQKGGHNMEEEPAAEEGGMNSDTTMMAGVVLVLVAVLAFVLVRRNKKKKEAELASVEHTHVGT